MAMMNRPAFRLRPSCRDILTRLSRRTSLISIATTRKRITPVINPAPPTISIKMKIRTFAGVAAGPW
jgi:hypothetical protein